MQTETRGKDFSIHQRVSRVTNPDGTTALQTNAFTAIGNNMHYLENGEWKESENIIEPIAGGAIVRRGPHKTTFSSELNSPAVFDTALTDGSRLRGGIRRIQITDLASGRSAVVAELKNSVTGELLPPHTILFKDAFQGFRADVVYIWNYNFFSQEIVLIDRPRLPVDMNPATTRLEIVSEFLNPPEARLREQQVNLTADVAMPDHSLILFGEAMIVPGNAFPLQETSALSLGTLQPVEGATAVEKQWHQLLDGKTFLIESMGWEAVEKHFDALQKDRAGLGPARKYESTAERTWPKPIPVKNREVAMMTVREGVYRTAGLVVDFVIIPDQQTPTTFASDSTCYVRSSYSTSSSLTFQQRCYLKFKANTYLMPYGPLTFPASPVSDANKAFFTSRNDDLWGERIQGVSGEKDSDGDPTIHTSFAAIWSYNNPNNNEIKNARIRWAQYGLYYTTVNYFTSQTVKDSLFQECTTGVYAGIYVSVSLVNVARCDVTTPSSGYVSGTMSVWSDCDVQVNSTAKDTNNPDPPGSLPGAGPQQITQNESAVAVIDGKVIIAWMDTNKGHNSLGHVESCCYNQTIPHAKQLCSILPQFLAFGRSTDGGATFVDKDEPPVFEFEDDGTPNTPPAKYGDAGDPVLAVFDPPGPDVNVYLAGNPKRPSVYTNYPQSLKLYVPFWKSTDAGATFGIPINLAAVATPMAGESALAPHEIQWLDKPWIAVDPANGDIFVCIYWKKENLLGSPITILLFRSQDHGANWSYREIGETAVQPYVVARNGTIYFFWRTGLNTDPIRFRKYTDRGDTLAINTTSIRNSVFLYRDTNKRIKKNAHDEPYGNTSSHPLGTPGLFHVVINPTSGHLYLVYHDYEPDSANDTDILFMWSEDGAVTWKPSTGPIRVNDVALNDQWQPSIAVKPDGSKLFIGWYDRKDDAVFNHRIRYRGMKATITQTTPLGSPVEYFDISSEDFAPVLAGKATPFHIFPFATTANLAATRTINELIAQFNGPLIIDDRSPPPYSMVLVKEQNSSVDNGTYMVADVGSSTTPWRMVRQLINPGETASGMEILITAGAQNKAKIWYLSTQGSITHNSTPLNYLQKIGFDPVWAPEIMSFDQNIYDRRSCPREDQIGDYDQAFSDNSFIYCVWTDGRMRRNAILQTDIRFKKITW